MSKAGLPRLGRAKPAIPASPAPFRNLSNFFERVPTARKVVRDPLGPRTTTVLRGLDSSDFPAPHGLELSNDQNALPISILKNLPSGFAFAGSYPVGRAADAEVAIRGGSRSKALMTLNRADNPLRNGPCDESNS